MATGGLEAWQNFVRTVDKYNTEAAKANSQPGAAKLPLIEPVVVLRSHNFDKCTPTPVKLTDPAASPLRTDSR